MRPSWGQPGGSLWTTPPCGQPRPLCGQPPAPSPAPARSRPRSLSRSLSRSLVRPTPARPRRRGPPIATLLSALLSTHPPFYARSRTPSFRRPPFERTSPPSFLATLLSTLAPASHASQHRRRRQASSSAHSTPSIAPTTHDATRTSTSHSSRSSTPTRSVASSAPCFLARRPDLVLSPRHARHHELMLLDVQDVAVVLEPSGRPAVAPLAPKRIDLAPRPHDSGRLDLVGTCFRPCCRLDRRSIIFSVTHHTRRRTDCGSRCITSLASRAAGASGRRATDGYATTSTRAEPPPHTLRRKSRRTRHCRTAERRADRLSSVPPSVSHRPGHEPPGAILEHSVSSSLDTRRANANKLLGKCGGIAGSNRGGFRRGIAEDSDGAS